MTDCLWLQIAAAPLDAILTERELVAHTHVVPQNAVHFVENRSGQDGGIHVNLTWHSAAQVGVLRALLVTVRSLGPVSSPDWQVFLIVLRGAG